ncbi:hypothetical protein AEAC466_04840 [Asticcacaulis sp. AC466]|nr:hypothetical protein AEAC466_04840 [Asticcacaulis sp. AC466]
MAVGEGKEAAWGVIQLSQPHSELVHHFADAFLICLLIIPLK